MLLQLRVIRLSSHVLLWLQTSSATSRSNLGAGSYAEHIQCSTQVHIDESATEQSSITLVAAVAGEMLAFGR
jgi:hypothetical protein